MRVYRNGVKSTKVTRGDLVNSVAITPALAPCSMKEPVSKNEVSRGAKNNVPFVSTPSNVTKKGGAIPPWGRTPPGLRVRKSDPPIRRSKCNDVSPRWEVNGGKIGAIDEAVEGGVGRHSIEKVTRGPRFGFSNRRLFGADRTWGQW